MEALKARFDIASALSQNFKGISSSVETNLHRASRCGDCVWMRNLLDGRRPFYSLPDEERESPQTKPVRRNIKATIEMINERNRLGSTALWLACVMGHVDAAKLLIQSGADLEISDIKAQTPLYAAAKFNHLECAKVLLEAGSNPDGSEQNLTTPIYIAALDSYPSMMKLLIRHGADVNGRHRNTREPQKGSEHEYRGNMPVYMTLVYRHFECFSHLVLGGADLCLPSAVNGAGSSASLLNAVLRYACDVRYLELLILSGGICEQERRQVADFVRIYQNRTSGFVHSRQKCLRFLTEWKGINRSIPALKAKALYFCCVAAAPNLLISKRVFKEIEANIQNSNSNRENDKAAAGRGKWGGQAEFLLSCIGYCVGLGNVWRFPYLAYASGGGAFLIPYLVFLVLCGIPLFMMELSFGQFAGLGPITAWRAVPIFKGIGFGMVTVSFLVCIYYNVIIGWSLFYMFASFQAVLPWTQCDQWWNKVSRCYPTNSTNTTTVLTPTTVMPDVTTSNTTSPVNASRLVSTSEEYWKYRVLRQDQSSGIGDPGAILWDLCLCLLLAWIIVFLCLIKGVKSTGKVVYFTATFPYIILIILLIRGCTLEGALDGIIFYVKPEWDKLADPNVWSAAATQIFYSLGVSFGGLLTFASYSEFNNNIFRDTMIVSVGNCATSIFAGFVIFSVIGHMAFKLDQPVSSVIDTGPGLAFIAYPQAVALLPAPQLWSILFFFMLLTLGLDSQFAMLETVVTGLIDEFPTQLRKRKMLLTLGICVVAFLMGLIIVTEGGIYWFELYNYYSGYYGILFLSATVVVTLNWGYGFFFTYPWRFNKDIKMMIGFEPNWYFKLTWSFITPASILFLLIYGGVYASRITYNDYVYPKWADDLGICMSVSCAACIPIYAAFRVALAYKRNESIAELFKPSPRWGPSDATIPYDHLSGAQDDKMMTFDSPHVVDDSFVEPFPVETLKTHL